MTGWREATGVEDLFLTGETTFAFHRARLRFELAHSLFSSAGVDPGSALLLRHLQALPLAGGERVLDIGCGHGVLGIVLQSLDDGRRILSVDRDALACRYTLRNMALNEQPAENHRVLGSLGFDGVIDEGPFDLIVCNVPGKAGEPFIGHIVEQAETAARPGTIIGLVVVKPLAQQVMTALAKSRFEVVLTKGNRTHNVVIAGLGSQPDRIVPADGFGAGVYDRQQSSFASGSVSWEATTVTGLGEFDTLSYPTRLLRSALGGVSAGPSVVVNPGQGHRAVIAALAGYPPNILLGRDLLALLAARRNLVTAGQSAPELTHDVTIDALTDADHPCLILAHADDKVHGPWFVDQVERCLNHFGRGVVAGPRDLVLTGRASLLGRLEADLLRRRRGHVAYKESRRGWRAIRFRVG